MQNPSEVECDEKDDNFIMGTGTYQIINRYNPPPPGNFCHHGHELNLLKISTQ